MSLRPSFASLRLSLFAALGLGLSGCGGNVVVDHGQGGGGGGPGPGPGPGPTSSTGTTSTVCEGATPIQASNGADSGFARCPDGTIHRVAPVTCDPTITDVCNGTELEFWCFSDEDCKDGPNGRCAHLLNGGEVGGPVCGCAYSCADDADCGPGGVCVCNGVVETGRNWSMCAHNVSCVTGADCPSGECGLSSFHDGCDYEVALACRSESDACRVDAECADSTMCVSPWASGTWTCEGQNCAIGRPLLVDGRARTAPGRARDDWADRSVTPDLAELSPDVRRRLAAHWEEVAALEHASIASFARFTLELLALGAPPDLVRSAQQAALDEVEHARIAYALAGAYAGGDRGPGALDVAGVPVAADRRAIVRALIEEACVGETLGVAEALAMADTVEDPALRRVYARVAEDERRHAELAWRTLRWLLAQGGDGAEIAAEVFESAMAAAAQDPPPRPGPSARRYGLLSAGEIGALRRQALREVVRPCAEAILGGARA